MNGSGVPVAHSEVRSLTKTGRGKDSVSVPARLYCTVDESYTVKLMLALTPAGSVQATKVSLEVTAAHV